MSIQDFTYNSYCNLLELIIDNGYTISNYHTHSSYENTCILRHDIDNDPGKAEKLAEIEISFKKAEIRSTYFVLLTSNFYNIFDKSNLKHLKKIISYGHEIGLHFDETQYFYPSPPDYEQMAEHIIKEKSILEHIIEVPVTSFSFHVPSKNTLESDIKLPGMVNSYSHLFFKEFKYLSDSWHRWREDAEGIIKSKKFNKIHLLTHSFWYTEFQNSMHNKLFDFFSAWNKRVYDEYNETAQYFIPPLSEIISRDEI
jgi:hypothetical protein